MQSVMILLIQKAIKNNVLTAADDKIAAISDFFPRKLQLETQPFLLHMKETVIFRLFF